MEIYAAKGDEKQIELRWWHAFMIFTWLPATLCILIGSLFIWLADALLLDTHHFELSAKPKYKTEVKPKVDMTRETVVMRERGRIRAGIVTIPSFNGHISRAEVLKILNPNESVVMREQRPSASFAGTLQDLGLLTNTAR